MNNRGNSYRAYRNALSVAFLLTLGAVLVTDQQSENSGPVKSAPPATKVMESGVLKRGGLLLNQAVARGVNCPSEATNTLTVDAQLTQTDGYYDQSSSNPVVFVGKQTAVDGTTPAVSAEGGNLTWLSSGWALVYKAADQDYELDHFEVKPTDATPGPDGPVSFGELIGQTVVRSDLVGLELGAIGTHTDGQTTVNVTAATPLRWNGLEPPITLQIQCAA
jgi:hypothetical protein